MKVDKDILARQIGGKVAYYRKLREISQVQLAEKVMVNSSVISRLERGKYGENISVGFLMDIADALDIDYLLLLTFDEAEKRIWWGEAKNSLSHSDTATPKNRLLPGLEAKGGNPHGQNN